ncbi:hypothetical protein ABIB25_002976 [Nakamurella sp. UYEF19]|uniref:hypothetical protein n=1 Tax=Nakamurella sp. UYEF19 TaxID=1756392 RepID=UPI003399398A
MTTPDPHPGGQEEFRRRRAGTTLPPLADQIGFPAFVVMACTISVGVWAWISYGLAEPHDFLRYTIIDLSAVAIATVLHTVARWRLARARIKRSAAAGWIVYVGPQVLCGIIFLIVTPASTPTASFSADTNIYGLILVESVLLPLVAAALVAVVVVLIGVPISWLLRGMGILPIQGESSQTGAYMSRAEYLAGAALLTAVTGFGVSMYFVSPRAVGENSRGRMGQQFEALVTLRGNLFASVCVVVCVAVIIAMVIVSERAHRRRMDAPPH